MPSALADHGSIAEPPFQRDGNADNNISTIGRRDGAHNTTTKRGVGAATATATATTGASDGSSDSPLFAENRSVAEAIKEDEDQTKKNPDRHSMHYIMRSFVAGGLAGCTAKTTVAPLDRVKILFQTSNPQFTKYAGSWAGLGRALSDIYKNNGVTGLFRGHSATLLKIYPYAAIKFVAYEQYRTLLISANNQETWIRRFSAGALAGVTSVFFTYPLEMIRVRLAFETKVRSPSLIDLCKKIYHEHPLPKSPPAAAHSGSAVVRGVAEAAVTTAQAVAPRSGIINFYRGFSTTMLGMIPYAGVSFLTHDTIGDIFRSPLLRNISTLPQPANAPANKAQPLQAWAELTAGGISGAVSQTVSYPLEIIRRRMQVAGAVGDGHRLRIAETAMMIFKERGFRGFFVGLTIGYIKIVPMSAVGFYTYERMKTILGI